MSGPRRLYNSHTPHRGVKRDPVRECTRTAHGVIACCPAAPYAKARTDAHLMAEGLVRSERQRKPRWVAVRQCESTLTLGLVRAIVAMDMVR